MSNSPVMQFNSLSSEKQKFLLEEAWLLTFHGGLGRTAIYQKDVSEQIRREFRQHVRQWTDQAVARNYTASTPTDDAHCQSLLELKRSIDNLYSDQFRMWEIPLGVVQKIFNLNLKYRWCMGLTPPPPHFPVDAIMLRKIPNYSGVTWTRLNCIETYREIIEEAKLLAGADGLAQWELRMFIRSF